VDIVHITTAPEHHRWLAAWAADAAIAVFIMSDDQNDPWRSLADQLGVQPGDESAAPPPPASPPSAASKPPASKQYRQPPASASPPPKKDKSDWNALAGELGLEVSAEDESSGHDHVAELLGFPPPSQPSSREENEHDQGEQYGDDSGRPANRDRWRDEDDQQRRSNMYDDTKPVFDENEERPASQDRPPADQERSYRPSRRRGGRGRGRSQGQGDRVQGDRSQGDRGREGGGSRPGYQQRESQPYSDARRSETESRPAREFDEAAAGGQQPYDGSDSSAPPASGSQERSEDDRFPKRRRRRRGRGGRSDRSGQPSGRDGNRDSARPSTSDEHDFHELDSDAEMHDEADLTSVDFTEVDFAATDLTASEEQYGIERITDGIHPALEPIHADADESDDHDDSGLSDFDDNHSGKTSVRDIITWKEAIGMIIDGNMQMRAQSPQSLQHHPRGQRGGRGRGRGGRGGNRR